MKEFSLKNLRGKPQKHSPESGFTLLELLLVIGIAAVMFLGIMKITTSWVDNEIADGAGQHLGRVSSVVQQYIEANWNAPLTATPDALNAGGPWSGLKDALDQEGLLDSTGALHTPLNSPMQIAFVTDTVAGSTIYRATIYATQSLPYKRVIEAARETGNTGGILYTFPNSTNAFGAFGQWKLAVTKLLPSGNPLPCVPGGDNACLLAVVSYNEQSLCGPFLYRTPIEGICAGGNTMTTDLNMNSHNITSAKQIAADNLKINTNADLGATTINGTTTMNGPATVAGGMQVSGGNMVVTGDATFSGNVSVNSGTVNTTTLNTQTIQAAKIVSNDLEAQQMNVTNGTLAVDHDVTVNNSLTSSGPVYAGEVDAGLLTANGTTTVGTMNVNNTMQINGAVNVTNGGTIAIDKLVVNHCTQINKNDGSGTYDSYGACP